MPARFRDLIRALAEFEISVEEPKSGSHWKARRGSIVYPIPAHNREKTEISDEYIRGIARRFGLDPNELWNRLR